MVILVPILVRKENLVIWELEFMRNVDHHDLLRGELLQELIDLMPLPIDRLILHEGRAFSIPNRRAIDPAWNDRGLVEKNDSLHMGR